MLKILLPICLIAMIVLYSKWFYSDLIIPFIEKRKKKKDEAEFKNSDSFGNDEF